jgi:hypothetical protein
MPGPRRSSQTILGWIGARLEWLILRLGRAGGGRAIGPLSFWLFWEWLHRVYYRPTQAQPGAFFRYVLYRHSGAPVSLADGTCLASGDLIAEIHLDNVEVSRRLSTSDWAGRPTAWAWVAMRQMAADLEMLAELLPPEVRALHGVTLLARATRRLGFEVRPLPRTLKSDFTRLYMLGLLRIYNPRGDLRLAQAKPDAYPAEIWFGRRAPVERYGRMARLG